MDGKYAVFEINGDECEQITIWLEKNKAIEYLADWRKRFPYSSYLIFERHDFLCDKPERK